MSLFDVIRWPISDWRNISELANIPIDIVRPWALDCLAYIAKDYSEDRINKMDATQIQISMTAALFNHCRDYDGNLDMQKAEICCYYFTRMLRKRIEDV